MAVSASSSWRRGTALAVLLAFLPFASACFGSFELTRRAYLFNKHVSADKWLRSLTFFAMNLVPIYALAVVVDVLFANSVEFWAGSNPFLVELEPRTVRGSSGEEARLAPVPNGARLTVVEPSGASHGVLLRREAPGVVAAYDADGRLAGRLIGLDSGTPRLVGGDVAREIAPIGLRAD